MSWPLFYRRHAYIVKFLMKHKTQIDYQQMQYWNLVQSLSVPMLLYRKKTATLVLANHEALNKLAIPPQENVSETLDSRFRQLLTEGGHTQWDQAIERCLKVGHSQFRSKLQLPSARVPSCKLDLKRFEEVEESWIQVEVKNLDEDIETIKAREAQYRTMAEHFPNGLIALYDQELRYTIVNGEGLRVIGMKPEDLEGKRLRDVFPPEIYKRDEPALKAALAGETTRSIVPFGPQHFRIITLPVLDKSGQVISGLIMSQNITSLVNAEKQLQNTVQRLRLAINTAKLGIWFLDKETQCLEGNDQLFKIYGITRETFNDDLQAWQKRIHPDDQAHANEKLAEIFEGKTIYDVDFRIIKPEGSIRYINASGCPAYDADGSVIGWIGINIDVTAIKEREEFLREIFNNSLLAILVADDQGNYISVNPAACQLFGYDEAAFLQMQVKDLVIPDRTSTDDRYQQFLEQGEEVGEFAFVRPDGERRIAQYHAIRIEKDFNLSILSDITDKKEASKARAKAKALAIKNEELERFAYLASHDLQEPLRTIIGFASLLKKRFGEQLGQEGLDYTNFIMEAGQRMTELIKGLLSYSRLGNNLKLIDVDCQIILEGVQRDLESQISEANAHLEVGSLPTVTGFPAGLQILFQNLISNSIKFRSKDIRPLIQISAELESDKWIFCVADNGIGIDPIFHEQIFNIFNRLHTRQEYEGTGIGLAHCKRVVELLGGEIWLESTAGKGSKFFFSIPA